MHTPDKLMSPELKFSPVSESAAFPSEYDTFILAPFIQYKAEDCILIQLSGGSGFSLKLLLCNPEVVNQSPVTRQQGNLTGTVRQIRDNVADMYNLVQKWNSSFLKGVRLLQDITEIKLSSVSRIDNTIEGNSYPKGLQNLCDDFEIIFIDLVSAVNSMRPLVEYFRAIRKLEESRGHDEPLFLTWPTSKFETESSIILKAYEKELEIKRYVKENICHSNSKDSLLLFVPLWVQQCHVDSNVNFCLEAMLKECGHR